MYDTPYWVSLVQDIGVVVAVVVATVSAVIAVGRFLIVKPLESYIDQRTPKNGGKSLGELHAKVDALHERVINVEKSIIRLDNEVEHLAD
jgi:hypothetical protein